MSLLARLRVRTKLALLLGLFTIGLVAITTMDASNLHGRLYNDRVDKLKAAVDMVYTVAKSLQDQVAQQKMTREDALARLRDTMYRMRFDDGIGYVTLLSLDGTVIIHSARPNLEGKAGTARANDGRLLNEHIKDIRAAGREDGTIAYSYPKPGKDTPEPKLSYVRYFAPCDAVFLAGVYVDDLEAVFRNQLVTAAGIGFAILVLILTVTWLINRDISTPLGRLNGAMKAIAHHALDTEVPGLDRRDEIGQMASAVQIFKDNALEMDRMRAEQEKTAQQAAADKKRAMDEVAGTFEADVGAIVDVLASAVVEMKSNATMMTDTANETSQQATAVAAASEQASVNVQSVAGAAEELSTSVAEISRQVATSSAIAAKAAEESERTTSLVNGLADAAQKIGAVTNLINDIAAQTNLLALNATIEAARAGEAGKGFAVVAGEVKNLASQTAKATEEISGQIAAMQDATGNAVSAIHSIGDTISQLNEIATTIASAVEEQGAATEGIARNVQQAAAGTAEVSQNVSGVTRALNKTGRTASDVLVAVGQLSQQAETLRQQVGRFLTQVRAA